MSQNSENFPPNWDANEEECQYVPLTCPWTITCKQGTLKFIITSLEWTFNSDLWMRVTAHSEGNPNLTKQINIDNYHALLESQSEGLNDYVTFPEPHLDSFQLHILGELLHFFFLRRYNFLNGQCSSSLSGLGTGQIFWHRPRPGCRSIHLLNRVQNCVLLSEPNRTPLMTNMISIYSERELYFQHC